MPKILDSGTRREFSTGAVRDMSDGKGDMYSMPPAALLRLSKQYEQGAKKYSRHNYMRGIPISAFLDSALRHIFKYLDGWDDEDHLSAAAFNILGAIQMEERNPDMQDVDTRKGKKIFYYSDKPD
ncbi:MAG: dATP/dGTP diphosphohydrolase domain-containing protein [Christensenellales bacterium]